MSADTVASTLAPKHDAVQLNRGGMLLRRRWPPLPSSRYDEFADDGAWLAPRTWSKRQRRKALSLVVLTVQNSALTLTMRYSRTKTERRRYLASEAVVMSELCKAVVSLCFSALAGDGACRKDSGVAGRMANAARAAYAERGSYVLVVPAALYAIQNNLQYVAASNLEPAIFQLLYQMKLLSTAFFSVLLLGRRLRPQQWTAIALLAAGLAEVGWPTKDAGGAMGRRRGAFLRGFAAVFAACCSSGFSSVYFERVVKRAKRTAGTRRTISVWARNAQLATFSSVIAALGAALKDGDQIRERGFLAGFTPLVWTVVALQAGGGLCESFSFVVRARSSLFALGTAAVIAYADNLLKGFATGISMIISTIASCYCFDFTITKPFIVGASFVFAAIFLYARYP